MSSSYFRRYSAGVRSCASVSLLMVGRGPADTASVEDGSRGSPSESTETHLLAWAINPAIATIDAITVTATDIQRPSRPLFRGPWPSRWSILAEPGWG